MKKENDTRPATNEPNRPPIRKSTLNAAARGDEMPLVAILPMLLCCCCDSNGREVKKVSAGMIRRKEQRRRMDGKRPHHMLFVDEDARC